MEVYTSKTCSDVGDWKFTTFIKERFFSFQHPSALVEHHVNIFPKYQTSQKHCNESSLSGTTSQRHAGALKNHVQPKGLKQPGSKKSYYSRTRTRILNDTQRLKDTPKPSSSFLPNNPTSCSQNLRIELAEMLLQLGPPLVAHRPVPAWNPKLWLLQRQSTHGCCPCGWWCLQPATWNCRILHAA